MRTRREFLKVAGSTIAMLCTGCLNGATKPASAITRPNIVLVFIDDMGWADFSCFGNNSVKTENIDQIAKEGIRFEQFYVNSPICSPSRVAISTGQYPQRWRITSYLNNRKSNNARGMAQWLDPGAPMLARHLKQSGYATGHFGKWHMGGQRDVTNAPQITEYGFDESLTNFEGLGAKLLPLTKKPNGKVGKIWADAERLGKPVTWMQRSEITTGFVDAAISFIDRSRKDGKPFYVNLWPDDVHSPFWPPVDKWGDGSKRQLYHGVLKAMDIQFGKLFSYIKGNEKLRNNTLVLICSDNGPEPGAGSAKPFKGNKTMLYEGGIRSPLVVWGPGLIDDELAGKVNTESFFAAIDLVPSLLKIANVKPKNNANFDGEQLCDVLLGRSQESRVKPLFFRRPPDRNSYYGDNNLPDLAVRDGNWKLLCDYDGASAQLYDLQVDPSESNNVARQHLELVKKLTAAVIKWHKSMPPDNGATFE